MTANEIDVRDFLLDEFVKNRQYYKDLIKPLQTLRDKFIDEESNLFYREIMDEYQYEILTLLFQDIAGRFAELPVDDIYCELDDMNLNKLFEPEN